MRHDVYFYELLSKASDEILRRSLQLNELRANLDVPSGVFGDLDADTRDQRVREISELYLAIENSQQLYAELEQMQHRVKLLAMYTERRVGDEAINLLFEEIVGE